MAAQPDPGTPQAIEPKGRPIFLFQRIPLAAAPVPPGTPSQVVRADPTLMAPPEAMRVDWIILDAEEQGAAAGIRCRPMMVEQEFWSKLPAVSFLFHNLQRPGPSLDYGEHYLDEPYLMRRGSHLNITIENRMVGLEAQGYVLFDGYGVKSKRPKQLVIPFQTAAGAAAGVKRVFGGQQSTHISGREDLLITKVAWKRGLETEGWNPRLLGIQISPSQGQKWVSKGGTAQGAGTLLCPLAFISNIRGPELACYYKPDKEIIMEQGDEISFEFDNLTQGIPATALLGIIGTSVAK